MKFSDKKKLVLETLYKHRFEGHSHSITGLLSSVGVDISREESLKLGELLENEGMIDLAASKSGTSASITGYGIEHVEQSIYTTGQSGFSDSEIRHIHKKLDEILSRISKLEIGQQVTYDDLALEVEDLKDLTIQLSKKNWLEILQGKMVTLGLGKLTDEVIEVISESLKDSKLIS